MQTRYRCGHALEHSQDHTDWHLAAVSYPCPACLRAVAAGQQKQTAAYVNLQQLSPAMAAFVLEVADAPAALGELLAQQGYASSTPSRDECTPGYPERLETGAVWRKEFHFAVDISPGFVLALMEMLKHETMLLSAYFPAGSKAVAFMAFPQRNRELESELFEHGCLEKAWHASALPA
ncbi:hypothetical protein [Chitinilyticum aquatile]|uniref:hypothetical protein n=1 Tax=Chitinilyticum aquatile TaxID=362520 RepID=UPI00041E45A8|nr:hypothetical protein [Chitinilyticum aquatile]